MIRLLWKCVQLIARKKEPVTDRSEFMRGWLDAADFVYRHQCGTSSTESTRTLCEHVLRSKHENIAYGQGWEQFVDDMLNRLHRPAYFPGTEERLGEYRIRIEQETTLRRQQELAASVASTRNRVTNRPRQGVLSLAERMEQTRGIAQELAEDNVPTSQDEADAQERGWQHAMGIYNMNRQHKTFAEIHAMVDRSVNAPWTWEQNERLVPYWLEGLGRGWEELQRIYRASPHLYVHDYRERKDTPEPSGRQGAARRTTLRDT